jgi:hypothetical protein
MRRGEEEEVEKRREEVLETRRRGEGLASARCTCLLVRQSEAHSSLARLLETRREGARRHSGIKKFSVYA